MRNVLVGGLVLALFPAACREQAQSLPRPAAPLPAVRLDAPLDAARTALLTARAHIAAAARRDSAGIRAAIEQLALRVADADAVAGRMPQAARAALDRASITEAVVASWARIIHHYADDFDFGSARTLPHGTSRAAVYVRARGPDGAETWLRVDCVRVHDEWRVAGIDFAPEPPASQPAVSAPA